MQNETIKKKVMLCVWWRIKGILYWEILPTETTVDSKKYCVQLEKVDQKSKGKYEKVYFLHDNERPHASKQTMKKLLDLKWFVLPHPPYSPDLAPTDYHLFRSLSSYLKDKSFDNEGELKWELQKFFDSKPEKIYLDGIFSLYDRWQKVLENNGSYIT